MGTAVVPLMPNLWRFSLSLTGQPDVADDLTQTTCLRAIEKADQFEVGTNLRAWLFVMCRRVWLNELRSRAIRKAQSLESVRAEDLPADRFDTETNIFAAEVFTEVMALPEAMRQTVVLVYVEGFAYREAAEVMDVPIGTVMSRLATARKRLAPLGQDGSGEGLRNADG